MTPKEYKTNIFNTEIITCIGLTYTLCFICKVKLKKNNEAFKLSHYIEDLLINILKSEMKGFVVVFPVE